MDREKVVTALECLADGQTCACCDYKPYDDCSRRVARDALALLKGQQQEIWELQDQVEYLTDKQKEQKFLVCSDGKITPLPVIVRCKDCKWRGTNACFCKARDDVRDNWFCSEGERKEGL